MQVSHFVIIFSTCMRALNRFDFRTILNVFILKYLINSLNKVALTRKEVLTVNQ